MYSVWLVPGIQMCTSPLRAPVFVQEMKKAQKLILCSFGCKSGALATLMLLKIPLTPMNSM